MKVVRPGAEGVWKQGQRTRVRACGVRKGQPRDVGGLHADRLFRDYSGESLRLRVRDAVQRGPPAAASWTPGCYRSGGLWARLRLLAVGPWLLAVGRWRWTGPSARRAQPDSDTDCGLAVGFAAVTYAHHPDFVRPIVYLVHNAVVANPDAPVSVRTGELAACGRGLSARDRSALATRGKTATSRCRRLRSAAASRRTAYTGRRRARVAGGEVGGLDLRTTGKHIGQAAEFQRMLAHAPQRSQVFPVLCPLKQLLILGDVEDHGCRLAVAIHEFSLS